MNEYNPLGFALLLIVISYLVVGNFENVDDDLRENYCRYISNSNKHINNSDIEESVNNLIHQQRFRRTKSLVPSGSTFDVV